MVRQLLVLLMVLALLGCDQSVNPAPRPTEVVMTPSTSPTEVAIAPFPSPAIRTPTRWSRVGSWAYQLQKLDVEQVAATKFDLIVSDYSADGSEPRRFTPEQVAGLKAAVGAPRLVLAYLSIGEAEDYRYYWQQGWRPGNPSWIGPVNPRWKGNYPVEYWRPEWQRIIYGSPDAYLDKIIDAGFDGVYLDLIDAYETFERRRPSARQDMVAFVGALARHARVTRGKSDFGIFPQNGEPLADIPGYLEIVTGIGREDVYYGNPRDDRSSPPDFTRNVERYLDRYVAAGKLVLTIDYTQRSEQIADAYRRARQRGYVPYATVRALDKLVINRGHDPE
ncbi:MAG: endo alpha-1,4 polygalactosaminidase [Chloroflexi bacterium]|nr:endo alpha-1,4 polygalactosaminidase [Chloroflexota bacterium]